MTNNWYGDKTCDTFCRLYDPDCSDPCARNGTTESRYGDFFCDTDCTQTDPDCE